MGSKSICEQYLQTNFGEDGGVAYHHPSSLLDSLLKILLRDQFEASNQYSFGNYLSVPPWVNSDSPINTLTIPLQNPILDHVTSDSCGVIVVLGNNRVEFLLGILGGGG